MKENDFLRIRFDVFPTNPSGESEATGNPTFPSNGRNLTCLAAENQLQERNAHEFASRIPSTVPGACTLICSPAFARRYAFAQQLFMRKIRMRERGTERALTGCLVRYAKGAPIPQTPHESSYRKEDSMRNRLLATTAAMLVGMTLAAAQNLPNAQSESGSAGADRQQQGRDMQRGAQDSGSAAQDKRGQSQRSEQRQQRDQTTGQSQAKDRDQNAQGQNKQEDRGNSAQSQNKESQSKQGQSKQDQSKPRSETQRNQTTGQGQHEQSRKNDRDQTQGQAPQRQQGQSNQGKQGQAQQGSPKQGGSEQSQSGQNQPQAPQGQNQAQQGRADGNVTLTSEQRTKIQQTVLAGNNVPRVNNVNFALNVGVSVPRSVRVVEVPPTLIEIYPQWRGHQYFVVHDDIVIVDGSRRIVTTLPMSSSAGNAAQVDRRGGGAQTGSAGDLVNLGPDEIRQVQIVLKERGFYRGEPDGVLGPATTQALIVFHRREGLQANGRIDTRTVTALGVSNRSGQQGNQNEPATTGQSGNSTQQSPANENAGRGGQPSAGQNNSNAMPQNNNEKQQQPANQNAGAGQKNDPSGNQPATTGQGGDRSQQPAARQGSGSDKSGQPADQKPQQGNPNRSSK
jgi:putative peptidoglycan binding protein/uncharacterized protein DUF1236